VLEEEVGEWVDFGAVFLGVGTDTLGHLKTVLGPRACSLDGPGKDRRADLRVVLEALLEGRVAFLFRDSLRERKLQDAPPDAGVVGGYERAVVRRQPQCEPRRELEELLVQQPAP
jgi:hypothetical protein